MDSAQRGVREDASGNRSPSYPISLPYIRSEVLESLTHEERVRLTRLLIVLTTTMTVVALALVLIRTLTPSSTEPERIATPVEKGGLP